MGWLASLLDNLRLYPFWIHLPSYIIPKASQIRQDKIEPHADVIGCTWVQIGPDLVNSHALIMNDQLFCNTNKNDHLLMWHAYKQTGPYG